MPRKYLVTNEDIASVIESANAASQSAQNALEDASKASITANTALDTANTALDTAQAALNAAQRPSGNDVVITLGVASWVDNSQTVSVADVTDNDTIWVSPDPSSDDNYTAYVESGVRCTEQGEGTLIFVCKNIPNEDLIVNVTVENRQG